MLPSSKSDIYSMVATESEKSKAVVKFVIQNFEQQLRFVLRHPFETTKYIMLEWLGTFKLKDKKVIAKKKKLEVVRPNSEELEYFNNIINKYYEKTED